ncbi:MAG: response regulator [Candidatus Omnitrophota bacterium]|jgi:DNA-binding response OmpR family regulator|nr:MAG: response regulator [Candidatus Omnitrophota bacterium]
MKRILIIDDEPDIIRKAKYALEEAGYDIWLAQDGLSGLDKLKKFKPDLILLDLVLPDQSGFKVAQEIKSRDEYRHIPIVAISLKKDEIDKHVAAKSGIVEYVEKPIDIQRLLYCISDILKSQEP